MSNFSIVYDLPIDSPEVGKKFSARKFTSDQKEPENLLFEIVLDERGKLAAKNCTTGEIVYPFIT